jgi:uncharacterized protein
MSSRSVAKARYDGVERRREVSPIPTPPGRWVMGQRWEELLFCSWPVPVDAVRPLVPSGLEIDTAEGSAWVSVVPMWMEDAHFRRLPPLPFISTFPEVNLRTYVRAGGYAGVWFLSLDTESRINVWIARYGFHLPYFYAEVSLDRPAGGFHFRSSRPESGGDLDVRYFPQGDPRVPKEGTLEHFLTERYSMFCSLRKGRLYRGDIHHDEWQIQHASMELRSSSLVPAMGVDVSGSGEPVVFFSPSTDVVLWRPVEI